MKEDKRRFLVSLRPSDVRLSGCSNVGGLEEEGGKEVRKGLAERLEQYLSEREAVMGNSASRDMKLTPGTVVRGEVCPALSLHRRSVLIALLHLRCALLRRKMLR